MILMHWNVNCWAISHTGKGDSAVSLSNTQYEAIIKGYEQTRERNRHLLEERREKVYSLVPEYQELDASVSSISVSHAKRMLDGDENALDELRFSLSKM